jgi:hypothetical protein
MRRTTLPPERGPGRRQIGPASAHHAGAALPTATASFAEFLWIWNTQENEVTPLLHLTMANWLEAHHSAGDHRLLLMAFRSAGKSTVVGMWCAWLLYRWPTTRILVLAADQTLATKMVLNVRRVVERHPLCLAIRPQRLEEWAADRFTVRRRGAPRDPSMLARGILANFTGSRAEVIVADDVEVPNTADTAQKRAQLRARLQEASFVLVPGGTMLFIGTPHTADSIYLDPAKPVPVGAGPPFLADCARLVLPIMDRHGRSLWPKRFPPDAINALRRRAGPGRFLSQMMLEPMRPDAARLDPAALIRYSEDLVLRAGNGGAELRIGNTRVVSASTFWDPAFGVPGRGDASVLATLFADDQGGYWLHRIAYLTHDPASDEAAAMQLCRQVVDIAAELFLPAVTVESNGIGKFLPGFLKQEFGRRRLSCMVLDQPSTRNKDERILAAMEPVLAARSLHAHESVFATPLIQEMRDWRAGTRGLRDDGLDALAGCLLAEPLRLPRQLRPAARTIWRPGAQGYDAATSFDPIAPA